jgi:riboflavin biosynthesis pyrimidine reductase
VRRLLPSSSGDISASQLTESYAYPPRSAWTSDQWLRVNFVMSLDGAIAGRDGLSKSLADDVDRRVFRIAREACDVVLVGAGTLRTEDYSPSPRPLAIVSRQLTLSPTLRVFAERGPEHVRPMVMSSEQAIESAPAWLSDAAELLPCGATTVDLHAALAHLTARGLNSILCEGGPALFSDLLKLGLVDELILTVVPRLLGDSERMVTLPTACRLHPVQILEEHGTVLMQLRNTAP